VATIMGDGDGNGTAWTTLTVVAIAVAATAAVAVPRLRTAGLVGGASLRLATGMDFPRAAGLDLTTEAPMIAELGPRPVCSARPHPMGGEETRTLAQGAGCGEGGRSEPFRYD